MNWIVIGAAECVILDDAENFEGFGDELRAEESSIGRGVLVAVSFWDGNTLFMDQFSNWETVRHSLNFI